MVQKTTAKVIDSGLVINFQTTNPKSIWRCSMDKLNFAVFSIKEKNKKQTMFLTIDGKEEKVAVFDNKEDAEQAIEAVTKAMMTSTRATKKTSWLKRILAILIILFFIYIVFFKILPAIIITSVNNKTADAKNSSLVTKQQSASKTIEKKIKTGVPISADELFGN